MADVGSQTVGAGGAVEAGGGVTFVDPELTVGSGVTWRADARVVVDAVDAGAVAHAGTHRAILVVGLTVGSGESARAGARVRVDVVAARRSVLARTRGALVDVHLHMKRKRNHSLIWKFIELIRCGCVWPPSPPPSDG